MTSYRSVCRLVILTGQFCNSIIEIEIEIDSSMKTDRHNRESLERDNLFAGCLTVATRIYIILFTDTHLCIFHVIMERERGREDVENMHIWLLKIPNTFAYITYIYIRNIYVPPTFVSTLDE